MHEGRLVFAQLMDFFLAREFDECVKRYRGNYRVRDFSCRDQFLAMAFAQLTHCEIAGYRNPFERRAIETVPRGLSWQGFQEHAERHQQASRLADLCRLSCVTVCDARLVRQGQLCRSG